MITQLDYDYSVSGSSHDLVAGTHRYMLVAYHYLRAYGSPTGIGTLRYDIVNLAQLTSYVVDDMGVEIWGAAIPDAMAAGTYSFVQTGSGGNKDIVLLGGVARTPVLDTASLRYGASVNGSTIALTAVGGGWLLDTVCLQSGKAMEAGASQTEYYNNTTIGLSRYTTPSYGDLDMVWTWSSSRSVHCGVSLRPYRGGGMVMIG